MDLTNNKYKKNWQITYGIEHVAVTEEVAALVKQALFDGKDYVELPEGSVISTKFQKILSPQQLELDKRLKEGWHQCKLGVWHIPDQPCQCAILLSMGADIDTEFPVIEVYISEYGKLKFSVGNKRKTFRPSGRATCEVVGSGIAIDIESYKVANDVRAHAIVFEDKYNGEILCLPLRDFETNKPNGFNPEEHIKEYWRGSVPLRLIYLDKKILVPYKDEEWHLPAPEQKKLLDKK